MKQDLAKQNLFSTLLKRRDLLNVMGGAIAVSLFGCFRKQFAADESTPLAAQTSAQANPACVVKPQQTEGPYFVDERLNRSDIRSDPSDSSVRPGVQLRLAFRVSQIQGSTCVPLPDAIVDIWHCDAEGVYSDVNDRSFSTVGKKFLRGYQVTNANGTAEFLTIFPGWYSGRTVHIHFKIRTPKIRTAMASQPSYEFTSQLYFDDALTDQIHSQPAYANRGQRTVKNSQDGIFQEGGEQLMVQLARSAQGYNGSFDIGLVNNSGTHQKR